MAGVGEASAIVGLIATAAQISKAVIGVAGKYKAARKQIESFGHEIAILGTILDQLYRLLVRDHLERDREVYSVMITIVDQCSNFFSELDVYKDTLCTRQAPMRSLLLGGRTKWVFEGADLEYLRARLESMKTNMLLMMTMQCMHSVERFGPYQQTQENARQVQLLALQSDACVKRLETLEQNTTTRASSHYDPAIDRRSIVTTDTAASTRSMRESIMSLYGHQSYYENILDPREGAFHMAPEMLVDHFRISMIIEDHLHANDTTRSPSLPHPRDQDTNDQELAGEQRSNLDFEFDLDVADTEATASLWNTVFTHKETRASTPSEESDLSTVITRASNIIKITYIPGVTNRSAESTPDTLPPLAPTHQALAASIARGFRPTDKLLQSLPIGPSSVYVQNRFPHRAKAIYPYDANPDDPNELDFAKGEIFEIDPIPGSRWWDAKKQTGEVGIVPHNYMILL